MFGIAMVMLPEKRVQPIKNIVHSLHGVFLQIVGIIMRLAPYGVCALLMSLMVELVGERGDIWGLFKAMGAYVVSVLLSLAVLIFVVYPLAIQLFTGRRYVSFLRGILPAQLLAFGTSSSVATLPATMRCVEKNIRGFRGGIELCFADLGRPSIWMALLFIRRYLRSSLRRLLGMI